MDQFVGGMGTMRRFGDTGGTLDQPEVGHGIGERAGKEIQAPVQLFLAQVGHALADGLAERTQHVAVVVGQELAQVVVLLGVGARDHAHEGTAVLAVLGQRQRRLDEGGQHRAQLPGMFAAGALELRQAGTGHLVHAAAEHLVDQVFLGAEVIVDRSDVDVGLAGHLAQRRAGEAVLCEQLLGRAEDAVLGREVGGFGHRRADLNQTIV